METLLKDRKEALRPVYEQIDKMLEDQRKNRPQIPEQPQLPPPPDPQRQQAEFAQTAQGWMGAAIMIIALGSRRAAIPGNYAMAAFGNFMNGLAEGNEAKIKREYDQWKQASDVMIKNTKQQVAEYDRILKNNKLDIDQKFQQLEMKAAEWQSEIDYEALRRKNLVDFDKMNRGREAAALRARVQMIQAEKMRITAEAAQAKKQAQNEEVNPAQLAAAAKLFIDNPEGFKAVMSRGGKSRSRAFFEALPEAIDDLATSRGMTQEQVGELHRQFSGERSAYQQVGRRIGTQLPPMKEFERLIGPLEQILKATGDNYFKDVNSLRQFVERRGGGINIAKLDLAINTLGTAYARAIAPVGTVHRASIAEARSLISAAMNKGQIRGVIQQAKVEIRAAERGNIDALRAVSPTFERARRPDENDKTDIINQPGWGAIKHE